MHVRNLMWSHQFYLLCVCTSATEWPQFVRKIMRFGIGFCEQNTNTKKNNCLHLATVAYILHRFERHQWILYWIMIYIRCWYCLICAFYEWNSEKEKKKKKICSNKINEAILIKFWAIWMYMTDENVNAFSLSAINYPRRSVLFFSYFSIKINIVWCIVGW